MGREVTHRCPHVNERGRRCELHLDHAAKKHSIFGTRSWCKTCGHYEATMTHGSFCSMTCKDGIARDAP